MAQSVSLADFTQRWARFAARWLRLEAADAEAADAWVARLLEVGLPGLDLAGADSGAGDDVRRPDLLRAEVAVLRRAGAVDEAGYRAHNPKMAAAGGDPVVNYCRTGWRRMRNPSLDLDGWWYRTEHLIRPDGAVDDTVNPLLHHLVLGRFVGLEPLPVRRPRPAVDLDGRRAVLFAAYDPDGLVDDSVVAYVRELARFADVFVLYDATLQPGQLARLDGLVEGAWVLAHGSYDFGSWARLAGDLVGWAALEAYDTVLLVNDSCYLLRPLDDVFAAMAGTPAHFWGLQSTARRFEPAPDQPQRLSPEQTRRDWLPRAVFRYEELLHVGSYFLALRRPAFTDAGLRRRLDSARHVTPGDRQLLVHQYETGTTQYLVGQGYDFATTVPGLRPFHPVYGPGYFDLVAEGFPLLKRRFMSANPFDTPDLDSWRDRVLAAGADVDPGLVDLAGANLERVTRR